MSSRLLKLRYPAKCAVCASALPAGIHAEWDPATRTVTCGPCSHTARRHGTAPETGVAPETRVARATTSTLDRGLPGASAQREYLRRRRNREARTRSRHPHLGRLLLAVRRAPQHESAFLSGALGEESVARWLDRRAAKRGAIVLHDRRMPRSRANIDHLAIAPTGVYVIDAKNISGEVCVARPMFGAAKLMINKRDRSRLVDGLDRQVAAVRRALMHMGHADLPTHGVFCFTAKANLPLIGTSKIRGHELQYRRWLARKLNRRGPLTAEEIDALARGLASAFPPN